MTTATTEGDMVPGMVGTAMGMGLIVGTIARTIVVGKTAVTIGTIEEATIGVMTATTAEVATVTDTTKEGAAMTVRMTETMDTTAAVVALTMVETIEVMLLRTVVLTGELLTVAATISEVATAAEVTAVQGTEVTIMTDTVAGLSVATLAVLLAGWGRVEPSKLMHLDTMRHLRRRLPPMRPTPRLLPLVPVEAGLLARQARIPQALQAASLALAAPLPAVTQSLTATQLGTTMVVRAAPVLVVPVRCTLPSQVVRSTGMCQVCPWATRTV